jgi:NADH-quinone oxidoreductase subunit L
MRVTWITALVGSLALIGFPGFSGFFSKDAIIFAVDHTQRLGAEYASVLLTLGVLVTAFYSFRMYFLVFHGKERMDEHTRHHLRESPWVVTIPLILLAIPSVVIGWMTAEPLLFGDWFKNAIYVAPQHNVLDRLQEHYFHGELGFVLHGLTGFPFWLAMGGLGLAAYVYWYRFAANPRIEEHLRIRFDWLYYILDRKYGFDDFNQMVFGSGGRGIGKLLWKAGDRGLIDGMLVNGSAKTVGRFAARIRTLQTGYLYHYAIAMIVGLVGLLTIFVAL